MSCRRRRAARRRLRRRYALNWGNLKWPSLGEFGWPPGTWGQVKSKLSDFDRSSLIALLHDLYAAGGDNRSFLHTRLGLGSDSLKSCKQVIARSLWPDSNKPASIAAAKKAISAYGRAKGRPEDMVELMIFFCEQAAGFICDVGLQDESYFDALLHMHARALTGVAALTHPRKAEQFERLSRVCELCRDIGYGVFDEMRTLLEEARATAKAEKSLC